MNIYWLFYIIKRIFITKIKTLILIKKYLIKRFFDIIITFFLLLNIFIFWIIYIYLFWQLNNKKIFYSLKNNFKKKNKLLIYILLKFILY